jgi:outer membrane lipase/esterase
MIRLSFSTLTRVAALMVACVLVGCGGASSTVDPLVPTRVIAFGDAFSTVDSRGYATYSVNTSETNATVASRIASIYGFTLKNYTASSSSVLASGTAYSYAAGDATVATTAAQIATYLQNNTPGSKDLFIITAGTQDIIAVSSAYNSTNTTAIASAAAALTSAIQTLTNKGAQYVLVMQPINVGRTPWAVANSYTAAQKYSYDDSTSTVCASFSCQLSIKLNSAYPATSSHQPVLLTSQPDTMAYFNLITGTYLTGTGGNTYSSYGVANPDTAVCNTFPSCDTTTVNTGSKSAPYTASTWNYTNSIFAYDYYTTPFANRLMGDYIYNNNFYRAGWR